MGMTDPVDSGIGKCELYSCFIYRATKLIWCALNIGEVGPLLHTSVNRITVQPLAHQLYSWKRRHLPNCMDILCRVNIVGHRHLIRFFILPCAI